MASHLAGLDLRGKSRDEIKAIADAKTAAVQDWTASYITNLHKPSPVTSNRRFERIAMAMVIHEERPLAVRVSTDGDIAKAQWLPRKLITFSKETDEFALVVMPGGIAIDRKFAQGTIPVLFSGRDWTPEQVEAWKALKKSLVRSRESLKRDATRRKFGRRMKVYDSKLPSYRVGE
ncbi:hypothetical protein V1291_000011 [Nitrobacteraceae bacterium AZCC 1564]